MKKELLGVTNVLDNYKKENIEESTYKYKFSVVTAVYNIEEYIGEAIESVINQSIGFEENIQLILVNDGSKDRSGEICDELKSKYPENIIVIHKENGGVSSARNEGLKYIEGRYVNFLDGDDKLDKNVMERVYNFFITREEQIDMVAIKPIYFEGKTGNHILNYKFKKGNRIIDLKQEYQCIQLQITSSFIKFEKAMKIKFDVNLSFAEDAKEVLKILLEKQQLGVMNNCIYRQRIREGNNLSATQASIKNKKRYLPCICNFNLWAYEYYNNTIGYIPLYVQFTILYDLQWMIKIPEFPHNLLNEIEKKEYFDILQKILLKTEDKIVLEQKHIWSEYKYHLLSIKYKRSADIIARNRGTALCFNNTIVHYLEDSSTYIDFINIDKKSLEIEGNLVFFGPIEKVRIYLLVNNELIETRFIFREKEQFSLNKKISYAYQFIGKVNLEQNIDKYNIQICYICLNSNKFVKKRKLRFSNFSPIGGKVKNSYWYKDGYRVTTNNKSILIKKCGALQHLRAELRFFKGLLESKQKGSKRAIVARLAYYILKPFFKRDIWLISDRLFKADDNGEALFKYMSKKNDSNIKCFYALSKQSSDFKRLKKYGKIIEPMRWKYKFYLLLGGVTISSHADINYTFPFYVDRTHHFYQDLVNNSKYVFLQHGVTKDNVSNWLNRYNKNFNLFLTATKDEYKSLLEYNYYYNDSIIKLTGFPRYDLLYNEPKKYLTIMPTWRNQLKGIKEDEFIKTNYFLFYNSLLNNSKLQSIAKQNGYTICFMPHPEIQVFLNTFNKNSDVIFFDLSKPYKEIFAESSMLITDYSSVAFDFAYLKKPLIYSQFDSKEFFSGEHIYTKGYFEYERDGFGEVEKDLESTVNRIIEYMENNCELKDKYRKRIDETFAFNDKNNCQRVYESIKELD